MIVVGAGPAGLQWGVFLAFTNLSFLILERECCVASFFRHSPWNRRLVSVNKRFDRVNVSYDFSLRHDWHSLLGTPRRMREFSRDYHPHADDYVRYLENVSSTLPIRFHSNVTSIASQQDGLYLVTTRDVAHVARHVVLATGYAVRPMPFAPHPLTQRSYTYDALPRDPGAFEGRVVIVIGSGNAALEVASGISEHSHRTVVYGMRPRMASLTHYPGDVRWKNMKTYDQYLLKSGDVMNLGIPRLTQVPHTTVAHDLVFCGGFTTANPLVVTNGSYPLVSEFYQDRARPRLWYAGVAMHGLDHRQSSGGFVHGFRYLIRAQFRYMIDHAWPRHTFDALDRLSTHLWGRMQHSSGLYQMQNVLFDVVSIETDGRFVVHPEVPRAWVRSVVPKPWCAFYFRYSKKHVWNMETLFDNTRVHDNLFLHPVVAWLDGREEEEEDLPEDVTAEWSSPEFMFHLHTTLSARVRARHDEL